MNNYDKSTNKVKSNRVLPYLLLFVILLILNIILASNINFSGLFNPGGSNGITDINKKIERIGEILEKRSKEEHIIGLRIDDIKTSNKYQISDILFNEIQKGKYGSLNDENGNSFDEKVEPNSNLDYKEIITPKGNSDYDNQSVITMKITTEKENIKKIQLNDIIIYDEIKEKETTEDTPKRNKDNGELDKTEEEKDEKMDEKEYEIVDDGEDEEITTDDGETETGDDDKNEEENNVIDIEEGDDDKTDYDETEAVDDKSVTVHDEEKIITPEGFIITDIGSINEVKTKNPPDKWMLQTGNNKIPLYEEKFENGLKAMTISDEKEEEYIITVSSSVFNYLKEEGAVEDDDGYLKAQAVKKDGTFFTNNKNIDHLKIETGNFSMIGTQIKMGGNIRIFFTGDDIKNQQVIKLGIFKGQVIIYYDDSKK